MCVYVTNTFFSGDSAPRYPPSLRHSGLRQGTVPPRYPPSLRHNICVRGTLPPVKNAPLFNFNYLARKLKCFSTGW